MKNRCAEVNRKTAETDIKLTLDVDGGGKADIDTGIGFFDHMLIIFAKHSLMDISITCKGDLEVDGHHTVEDVGIVLGMALKKALGDKRSINRYGQITLPMDEALVSACVDVSGRPLLVLKGEVPHGMVGQFDGQLLEEFLRGFAHNSGMTIHINIHYGINTHHIIEGVFKALARAVRQAVAIDDKMEGIPSTKGVL
ncbi:MAG TPA: imidazoleglycerol-phosphate dehydratase HisB [Clostridiales bacterium]|nr:imidazoleglycerol-phosphate dehydratase HisB [Clostridiales bacterium]